MTNTPPDSPSSDSSNNTTTNTGPVDRTVTSNIIAPIPNPILNETIVEPGLVITNLQGTTVSGDFVTQSTFNTTDPSNYVPQINQDLAETFEINYDNNVSTESNAIVNEIKYFAQQIKCEDFHGKGSIDDYNELFIAAKKIATETKQIQLDVDIEGFNEFGAAADELSALFNNFILRLQNINIINDVNFLKVVRDALRKIFNLSETFGRFKQTILATSNIKIPKSTLETKQAVETVMSEVNCAMNYINNFVNPNPDLVKGRLSAEDKNIINKAVSTIENWNILADQGVSIALTNNVDMQYIKQANTELKSKTNALKSVTSLLKTKFASLNTL
jgi:hypothetical protein